MKKTIFYTIFLMIISHQIISQVSDVYVDNIYFQKGINLNPVKTVDYSEIKGSPYLTDDFVMSKVYFRKDSVLK